MYHSAGLNKHLLYTTYHYSVKAELKMKKVYKVTHKKIITVQNQEGNHS